MNAMHAFAPNERFLCATSLRVERILTIVLGALGVLGGSNGFFKS